MTDSWWTNWIWFTRITWNVSVQLYWDRDG